MHTYVPAVKCSINHPQSLKASSTSRPIISGHAVVLGLQTLALKDNVRVNYY